MSLVLFPVIRRHNTAVVSLFFVYGHYSFTYDLSECNTRYYANYYVRKTTGNYQHMYYAGEHEPDFIHTAEHFFYGKTAV